MSRLLRMFFLLSAIVLFWSELVGAQQRDYGPAVRSYLLGLDEESRELDFQLRHGEISRSDYTRARQRLLILRRFIERMASQRAEDLVPELEVVTADEFGALGANLKLDADGLRVGTLVGERWRLLSIEAGRPRFFIFELLRRAETRAGDVLSSNKTVDPRAVIETIVVEERAASSSAQSTSSETRPAEQQPLETSAAPELQPASPGPPQLNGLRIRRFYLPGYSQEALAKGVEGELLINALFRRDGKIKEIVVAQSLGYGLDERARDAVRRTEFEPALIDVRAQIVFNFSLMKVTVRVRSVDESADTKRSLR